MFNITLLRHGESEGNLAEVIQGQSDYPLTPGGIEQAKRLASFWKTNGNHFDLIISSPLKRAAQTAEIISSSLNVPIKYEPSWMERNFGHYQGMGIEEINQLNPPVDFYHPFAPVGGNGESQLDLYTRANLALQNILRLSPGSYLVVSHGAILNKALYVIMGIAPHGHYNSPLFHFNNIGFAQFRYHPLSRQWEVFSMNSQAIYQPDEGDNSWQID